MRSKRILIIPALLAVLSLACSFSIDLGQPTETPGDPVATAVAATLAASGQQSQQATEPPGQTPTLPIHPTVTASPEPDFSYQGVSFSYLEGLLNGAVPEEIPAELQGPFAMPAHLRLDLEGYAVPGGDLGPVVKIYPTDDFRMVNASAGEQIDNLAALLETKPADPESIPNPDLWGAAQFISCQKAYVDFQNGSGVRYVTQWGQAAYPIGYPQMFYSFRGLTADGAYYVHVMLSVGHDALPDASSVTMDDDFYNNYVTYAEEQEAFLESQPPASFRPSLLVLDAFVQSIRVEGP